MSTTDSTPRGSDPSDKFSGSSDNNPACVVTVFTFNGIIVKCKQCTEATLALSPDFPGTNDTNTHSHQLVTNPYLKLIRIGALLSDDKKEWKTELVCAFEPAIQNQSSTIVTWLEEFTVTSVTKCGWPFRRNSFRLPRPSCANLF